MNVPATSARDLVARAVSVDKGQATPLDVGYRGAGRPRLTAWARR